MDADSIEVCWSILVQYIKAADRANAAEHLVVELMEAGIRDEDLVKLRGVDQYLETAIAANEPESDDDWDEDG